MNGLVYRLICLLTAVRRGINMVQCSIKIQRRTIKTFLTYQSKTYSTSAGFAHLNNPRLSSILLQPAHFHSCIIQHWQYLLMNIRYDVIERVTEVKNEINETQLKNIH